MVQREKKPTDKSGYAQQEDRKKDTWSPPETKGQLTATALLGLCGNKVLSYEARVWGDASLREVLAVRMWRHEFSPQYACKKASSLSCACNPSAGMWR